MKADLLHVIIPSFNLKRFESHKANLRAFVEHAKSSGTQVHVVELAYGDMPYEFDSIPGVNHYGVYGKTPVWAKERLINIGIARLPRDWKYVAWIDGDIEFESPGWAAETVQYLQYYDFVQPWETCYDLGPHNEHLELHRSFCRQWLKEPKTCTKMGQSGYTFAHPGYAWAATRNALERVGGLIDIAPLGSADHHMALALIGRAKISLPGNVSKGYKDAILRWEGLANTHITGNIGFVPGTIKHFYHGPKKDRGYITRWDVLFKHNFDPVTDLKVNTSGIYELAGTKPELRRDMMAYFSSRNEDQTVLGSPRTAGRL